MAKNKEFYAGQTFDAEYPVGMSGTAKTKLKVMSVVDGYVTARWDKERPFVRSIQEFRKLIEVIRGK